jgi:hypothetical protein
MATRRATIYTCDTPTCGYTAVGQGSDWTEIKGIHGTVSEVTDGGGVSAGKWFACKPEHVLPAIHHVLRIAWEGEGM